MPEAGLPQFPVYLHFHDCGLGAGDVVDESCKQKNAHIGNNEGQNGVHAAFAHEGVKGIALELGNGNVHQAAENGQGDHHENLPFYMVEKGKNLSDSKEFQVFGFVFHYTATSLEPLWVS